jgi:hypothetical protein
MSGAPLVIEVLARDGEVLTRHRIERLPATIGRALDNDVIVDDPFVAPLHLVLEARGEGPAQVVARDAGSRNGVYLMRSQSALARWFRSGGERAAFRSRTRAVDDAADRPYVVARAPHR